MEMLTAMLVVLGCWFFVCGRGIFAKRAQGSLSSPAFSGNYIATLMVASSTGPLAIFLCAGETGYRGEMCADWNYSFCSAKGNAFVFGGAPTRVPAAGMVTYPAGARERVGTVLPGWLLIDGHR